jgi:hypothetical protein
MVRRRDRQFIGREDVLSQVKEHLQIRHCVSLHGLGGIGYIWSNHHPHIDTDWESRKSQIAIEYAYRFFNSNPEGQVFWIYAANILDSIKRIKISLEE